MKKIFWIALAFVGLIGLGHAALEIIDIQGDALKDLVEKKATCPFIGTAVATKELSVWNSADNPLASIQQVEELGNSGGGDLGEVLVLFSNGNHRKMRDSGGALNATAPDGFFSLEFPGSQGSHPGHSGILQGDPHTLASGRFSDADFKRLLSFGKTRGGYVTISEVGQFIAQNLHNDKNSKVDGLRVVKFIGADIVNAHERLGSHLLEALRNRINGSHDQGARREFLASVTKTMGEENLIGSAGEFGLLFAFLQHEPGAVTINGQPALSVADLTSMFHDKKFPDGWRKWPKYSTDWTADTFALAIFAGKAYYH